MSLIDNVKRINVEEFKDEDKEVAGRIAEYYNYFAEQVTNTINGNLDFDNLNRALVTINVTINSSGIPQSPTQFTSNTGLQGTKVIRADNLTNSASYPLGSPFITWSTSGNGTYTIQHITGLQPLSRYRIVIELVF